MKKLLVFGFLLLLSATQIFAQGTYYSDYYSNNAGQVAGAPDQVIRIINVGANGTPISGSGDICANIYVFDSTQVMIACCSCRITPDECASASVAAQLTNSPLTGTVPQSGVVKVVTTPAGTCDPTAPLLGAETSMAQVLGTHLQVTGGATFVTETATLSSPLGTAEADFLHTTCLFVQYLGGGRGVCTSSTPCQDASGVGPPTNPIYKAFAQPPINAAGSSVFKANRGVVPVKFTLTHNDVPTCTLPPATISVTRTAGGTLGAVDESIYSTPADSGSNFRIDPTACQYVYNLAASSLGVGTYLVDISIDGIMVGHAFFALK